MTAILFRIELRKPDGNPKPIAIVRGVKAALAGAWCKARQTPFAPDKAQVRDALPHYYRKAFDRDGGFWFTDDGNAVSYLRGARHHHLAAIWATPLFPLLRPE